MKFIIFLLIIIKISSYFYQIIYVIGTISDGNTFKTKKDVLSFLHPFMLEKEIYKHFKSTWDNLK